jgi:hypothetical protein
MVVVFFPWPSNAGHGPRAPARRLHALVRHRGVVFNPPNGETEQHVGSESVR